MKLLCRIMKRAEKAKNRIIIPKFIIDKYGREFYLEVFDNGIMLLTPINNKKGN